MKYLQIKSLTWWSSVLPLLAGLFVASEPLHQLGAIVATIDSATGGLSAAVMINAGLAGIGIRGAMSR